MFLWCTLAWRLYWSCPVQKEYRILRDFFYLLRTWCGLNFDLALFWVFTSHRSQNIYNCLWLHCFWFMPDLECLNDSSMFSRRNHRPTTLFLRSRYLRIFCVLDTFVMIATALLLSLRSTASLLKSDLHLAAICRSNMMLDSLFSFLLSFLFLTFSTEYFHIILLKTTHSNSDRFPCLYQRANQTKILCTPMYPIEPDHCARAPPKSFIAVLFTICSFSLVFVLNAT